MTKPEAWGVNVDNPAPGHVEQAERALDQETEGPTEAPLLEVPILEMPTFDGERGSISADQYDYLMRPIANIRVATRSAAGKQLSYLESWDVRACLTRVFGFGNFDAEMLDSELVYQRDYLGGRDKTTPMWEVAYKCTFRVVIRDPKGREIARYAEGAVGSASGSVDLGGLHDNALKTAASDALKRCCINLGSQFGLSLYDHGSKAEVIRGTVVKPEGVEGPRQATPEQVTALQNSVGVVTPTGEGGNEGVETSEAEVGAGA